MPLISAIDLLHSSTFLPKDGRKSMLKWRGNPAYIQARVLVSIPIDEQYLSLTHHNNSNGVLVGIHAKVIGHASILAFPIFVRSMYDSRYMTHNVGSRKTSIFRTKVFSYTALSEFLFMWPV
ncbi:hypothetical protein BST61_g8817 [Cercospora zeina]